MPKGKIAYCADFDNGARIKIVNTDYGIKTQPDELKRRKTILFILLIIILGSLLFTLKLAGRKQEIRGKANSPKATLSLFPSSESFQVNETKTFLLKASFSDVPPQTRLDYFKTEVIFNKESLEIPKGSYLDTSSSGFSKIIRVDGPMVANQNSKITIELGASVPGEGPATDKPITIAKINFMAKNESTGKITIGKTQIVSREKVIPIDTENSQGANYRTGPESLVGAKGNPMVENKVMTTPVLPLENLNYITPTPEATKSFPASFFDLIKSFFCGILKNC